MVFSQFFILSSRGDVIISRDYRGDITKSTSEIFFRMVKKEKSQKPLFLAENINFAFIKSRGLFFVMTSKQNFSPSFALAILNRTTQVFKDYCGVLSEEAIRKNFVLIYELLDEMLDFGFPQETSSEYLKAFIYNEPELTPETPTSFLPDWLNKIPITGKTRASKNTNKPIAWTRKAENSTKNEIFVDLIERITVLLNSAGSILKSEIDGSIRMKSYLKGQPELKLGLNEDLVIGRSNSGYNYGAAVVDDINFHETCDLTLFERERVIGMPAPEGEIIALNYRISEEFDLPFRFFPIFDKIDPMRHDLILKIKGEFANNRTANGFICRIPVSKNVASIGFELENDPQNQFAEYKQLERTLHWTMRKFTGQTQHELRVKISLAQAVDDIRQEVGPISLDFEVPMWNPSAVQIRFLRIIERGKSLNPQRWVRVITQGNSYVCRLTS